MVYLYGKLGYFENLIQILCSKQELDSRSCAGIERISQVRSVILSHPPNRKSAMYRPNAEADRFDTHFPAMTLYTSPWATHLHPAPPIYL